MKPLAIIVLLLYTTFASGQAIQFAQDTIAAYFDEVRVATERNSALWDMNIYGPMLLVNPATRWVYANFSDTSGGLKPDGKIFTGVLPPNIVIANAAIQWNDIKWAMVLLPFVSKTSKEDRISLLSHELFHRSQAALNFNLIEVSNNHLDRKEGRIYLRLELEALKKALQAKREAEMVQHLTNAFTFRKYRYMLYPGADTTENWAELNEGMAEYSGIIISGRSKEETTLRLTQKIDDLMASGTFIRTFAYRTTPAYGYLLLNTNKFWNKQITTQTNLTDYFIKEFGLSIPNEIRPTIHPISEQYNGAKIISEEAGREEDTKKLIAHYKDKFVSQPHLEIVFERKSVSFDSRNLLPLEGYGTVYPTMTVSDNWGILTIKDVGGLMSVNRDKVTITAPLEIDDEDVHGDGWTLQLKGEYKVVKDGISGNYSLMKK